MCPQELSKAARSLAIEFCVTLVETWARQHMDTDVDDGLPANVATLGGEGDEEWQRLLDERWETKQRPWWNAVDDVAASLFMIVRAQLPRRVEVDAGFTPTDTDLTASRSVSVKAKSSTGEVAKSYTCLGCSASVLTTDIVSGHRFLLKSHLLTCTTVPDRSRKSLVGEAARRPIRHMRRYNKALTLYNVACDGIRRIVQVRWRAACAHTPPPVWLHALVWPWTNRNHAMLRRLGRGGRCLGTTR